MASMSSLNLKHFLFLLVLLASCALCSSHNGTDDQFRAPKTPPPPPAPKYDYFILALQWPYGVCSQPNLRCNPSSPNLPYFTVHGLWPQRNDGVAPWPCVPGPSIDNILKKLEKDLMTYWPRLYSANNFEYSKKLWTEQWTKHGSCSDKEAEEYFKLGIALGKQYGANILTYLTKKGIEPNGHRKYKPFQAMQAIREGIKKNVRISIDKHKNGNSQLLEVRLCFEKDAKTLKDCQEDFIFAFRPPETQFLGVESSIMEFEDAPEL